MVADGHELDRIRAYETPALDELAQSLIGCEWGRTIKHPEDTTLCLRQAMQMVVLHASVQDEEGVPFKLCDVHYAFVQRHSDPRRS